MTHSSLTNPQSFTALFALLSVHSAGDCINSSPAGKRRIAAEKQLSQLADEGNLFNGDAALMDASIDGGASSSDQIKSPVTFVALVAVAICSAFVIVFVTIFTILQVSEDTIVSTYVIFHVHWCVSLMMVQHPIYWTLTFGSTVDSVPSSSDVLCSRRHCRLCVCLGL